MGKGRAGHVIVVVVLLLLTLVTGITEAGRMLRRADMAPGNGGQPTTAEGAWTHCREELIKQEDSARNTDFCLWKETRSESKSKLLTTTNMHIAISLLPPKTRQEFLDCSRKNNVVLGTSNLAAGSIYQLIKCFDLLCCLPNIRRRYLAVVSPVTTNPAAATASPISGPMFQPHFQEKLQLESDTSDSSQQSPPASRKHSPPDSHGSKHHHSKKNDNLEKETLVAVIATAATTFGFVGMIFCCWYCCKSDDNELVTRYGHKDDRPLLNLSDFSAGPSQNSISLNSSSKDYSFGSSGKVSSFRGNLSMKDGNIVSHREEALTLEANAGEVLPPLKPPPGRSAPPPPAPPAPPSAPPPPATAPRPPPPPKVARTPPAPPPKGKIKPSPLGPHRRGLSDSSEGGDENDCQSGASKAKLKPFFWDKVMANPDHSMVWHDISAGSFQFNEEMIETLFGYNAVENKNNIRKKDHSEPSTHYIQIIDPRKAQNLSILIRALNITTEEILNAVQEGNELPVELLQTLMKMSPTSEEELKLRLFTGDLSQLGPAERFLKQLVEIPFPFKRIESLILMSSLQEEVSTLKDSFATLEVACNKLRHSRLFLKLLEAVLKTGNRMNDGTYRGGAQAFKLDTLLKLSDVKGTDGKTTLLHFVVQEIIRSEGIRAARTARASQSLSSVKSGVSSVKSEDCVGESNDASLEDYRNLGLQVVSSLSGELEEVKKAAVIDADVLATTLSKLKQSLIKTKAFLDSEMKSSEEGSDFYNAVASFVDRADSEISVLAEEEKRIMALVKSTGDYFHGHAGRDESLRLFIIVRNFLIMLDKVCKEVRDDRAKKPARTSKKATPSMSPSSENHQQDDVNHRRADVNHRRLFPAIAERRMDYSSSDDESPSP